MLVESKILLELDVPTVSGYIYPKELSVSIMKTIQDNNIGGVIYSQPNIPDPETIVPMFRVTNPVLIVDSSVVEPELVILCDIELDETKITMDVLHDLETKPWRLSVVGIGETEENVIKTYELKYVNIEIVEDI